MTRRGKRAPAPAPYAASVRREHVWPLRLAAACVAALGLIPLANLVTTGGGLPWWSVAMHQWLVWLAVIAIVALVMGRLIPERIETAFVHGRRVLLAPAPRTFALLAGALTGALSLYFGWRLFALEPVVGDEFAQRWQAHLLVAGRLFARAELHPEFFSTIQTLEVHGRWFSQFPMGGPALLALGTAADAVWIVNPLLAAISAAAFFDFVRHTTDETTARVAALLFALCPFVLFMAGSQMNHAGALACLMIALAALPRWLASHSASRVNRAAAVLGVCIGLAASIRPFDAAVVAVVVGVFQLYHRRATSWHTRSLLVQGLVGAIPVAVLLAANWATVGQPFTFAYDVLNGPEHRPGFHMTPLGFEHTPLRGLYMASAYLMKLDVGLFAWPVPAMLVVVVALLLMDRASTWDALLLALLGGLVAGYAAYWSESYFVGPRFLFTAVPIFVLYSARMPFVLRHRVRAPSLRAAVLLLTPLWLLVAWLVPPRDNQLYGVRELAHVYRMRATAPAITDAVRRAGLTRALVFIQDGWHARLTARLRATGVRPLAAEQLVKGTDACTLQRALDAADRMPSPAPGTQVRLVMDAVARDERATPLGGQPPSEQIALVAGRALDIACDGEIRHTISRGVSVAEMLPHQELDSLGALGGRVVYARDFGARNELLRLRFGDRAWYVARTALENDTLVVQLEPYRSHE